MTRFALALVPFILTLQAAAVSADGGCDCNKGPLVFPWGSRELPRNGVFFVFAPDDEAADIRLVKADEPVDVEVVPGPAPGMFEVRPKELLEPFASYGVELSDGSYPASTVVDVVDTTRPVLSDAVPVDAASVGAANCGSKRLAALSLVPGPDERVDARWLVRVEVEGAERPLFSFVDRFGIVRFGQQLDRGNSYVDCLGSTELGDEAPSGAFSARVVLIDEAGNESEPVVVEDLRLKRLEPSSDEDGPFGCRTTRGSDGVGCAWIALILVAALLRRRTAGVR